MPSKVRASLVGVTVSCGVISFDVDLVPATKKNADKRAANNNSLTRVCPECDDAVRIKQHLLCERGHGPFPQNELHHATEVDGELRRLSLEEVEDAKVPDVESKTVAFSVFPAEEVEAHTLPSGNVYRMRLPAKPSKATLQAYGLLRELVGDEDLAFVAELVVKGVSKLYRGINRDGMIMLTEMLRPSLFHAPDGAGAAQCDDSMLNVGRAMVADLVGTFDPDEWESAAERRLLALQAAARNGSAIAEPEPAPVTVAAEELLTRLRSAA